MSWNYRVIEFVDPATGPWRAIHEVHYTVDGKLLGYGETAAIVQWDADEGKPGEILDLMREALDKPVLVERDFQEAGR